MEEDGRNSDITETGTEILLDTLKKRNLVVECNSSTGNKEEKRGTGLQGWSGDSSKSKSDSSVEKLDFGDTFCGKLFIQVKFCKIYILLI